MLRNQTKTHQEFTPTRQGVRAETNTTKKLIFPPKNPIFSPKNPSFPETRTRTRNQRRIHPGGTTPKEEEEEDERGRAGSRRRTHLCSAAERQRRCCARVRPSRPPPRLAQRSPRAPRRRSAQPASPLPRRRAQPRWVPASSTATLLGSSSPSDSSRLA